MVSALEAEYQYQRMFFATSSIRLGLRPSRPFRVVRLGMNFGRPSRFSLFDGSPSGPTVSFVGYKQAFSYFHLKDGITVESKKNMWRIIGMSSFF